MTRQWLRNLACVIVVGVTGVAWGQEQQQARKRRPATRPSAAATTTTKEPAKPRTPESAVTPEPHVPKRHEEFMQAKVGSGYDLLFVGDSITDFWPKKGADSWAKFEPYRPLDFGVSGDRTEHVLWRIEQNELEGVHAKVCVILIGTNNIGHFADEKPEWAAAGVKKILDEVHHRLPGTKVLLLGVFPRDVAGSPKRKAVEEINQIISKYGEERDTTYLDIGAKFLDENGEIPADVMPDKLHPSAKGYEIWYEAMWPTLEKMLKGS